MTKNVSLTIGERVAAIGILNDGKFSNSQLAVVLGDIKNIAITPEEWQEAHLTKTPTDEEVAALSQEERANVRQTWKWDETIVKAIEIGQETVDFLHAEIKRKGDASELTIADSALLSLDTKITQ